MDYRKSKIWHIAGLALTAVLLLIFAATFVLGVCAFDTADYPAIGDLGIYPADGSGILPEGAAAVVRRSEAPLRGTPAAYYDADTEAIRFKYYYGEEDGRIILTNEQSEDVSEILPEQFRGCVENYIPLLGYFLGWACTLGGVCISLAAGILLMVALAWIIPGLIRILRRGRMVGASEKDLPEEESISGEEPLPEEGPERICGCIMEPMEDEKGMIFCGEAADVLKLSRIFRAAAEKRGAASVIAAEEYGQISRLKLTYRQEDEAFVQSVVGMLKERKET